MASNSSGDGKGHSKIASTSDEDAAVRRAAKLRRKHGKGRGNLHSQTPNGSILDEARMDRVTGVTTSALRVMQSKKWCDIGFNDTVAHLQRFGDHMVPDKKGGRRKRWSQGALDSAISLLSLYFYGPESEIEEQEAKMDKHIVTEVRRRFASACMFNRSIQDTPGQNAPWFDKIFAQTMAFHESRKATQPAVKVDDQSPDLVTA